MLALGVIVNPLNRANRADPNRIDRLRKIVSDRGVVAIPRSLAELGEVAAQFKDLGVNVLAINGGDGTVHVTLSQFYDVYGDQPLPMIALLRGGTLNTISRGLNIRGTPERLLSHLVHRLSIDAPLPSTHTYAMRIKSDEPAIDEIKRSHSHRPESIFPFTQNTDTKLGFIFGNGIIANFLQTYYQTPQPSPLSAAWLLARVSSAEMLGASMHDDLLKRINVRVTADNHTWSIHDFLTITAATIPDIGIGFRPFYRMINKPDAFAVLGIHCPVRSLVANLPRVRQAKPLPPSDCIDTTARDVIIESDDDLPYTIDGDLYHSRRVHLSLGPQLSMWIPESNYVHGNHV